MSLRKKLRWFDSKPLFGRRIVITRAADQAPDLIHRLADTGAEVISFPTIEIAPPTSWTQTDQAIEAIERFDWIVFTSSNGVGMFFQRLKTLGGDIRDLKGLRVAAIGPKTGASLNALGLRVDALPREYRGEALADALGNVKGQRILLAQALVARDILQKTLVARGADVTVATVYRTLKSRPLGDELRKRLLSKEIDVVTFTSSSTVEGFIQHFSARDRRTIFDHTKAAAIGPITAATLKEHGIHPTIRAKRYTTESLADAIVKHFLKRSS